MIIQTEYLGEVEVTEEDIYTFEEGLYGFPDSKRFVFVGALTAEFPFIWMQSIDDQTVFVVTDPFLFKENYDFAINGATVDALELKGVEEASVYATVVIPEDILDITANLKSPILINARTKKGKQLILNEDYPYKFKLFSKEGE